MLKEKSTLPVLKIQNETLTVNLPEAQSLSLPLSAQYDPFLQTSDPKLPCLAQLCKLGLCSFK